MSDDLNAITKATLPLLERLVQHGVIMVGHPDWQGVIHPHEVVFVSAEEDAPALIILQIKGKPL